jgi:hypothetical protein
MSKHLLTLIALSLSVLTASSVSVPAGAAAGMDLQLIKDIKNYVMPTILNEINNLNLGRINYGSGSTSGYVEKIDIKLHLASNDSVNFAFDPS